MHTITLPKGQFEVSFKPPLVYDRREMIKHYNKECGLLPEEVLAIRCIVNINGRVLDSDAYDYEPDGITDDWCVEDQQYFMEVFSTLYLIDDKGREKAQAEAKKLMGVSTRATTTKSKQVT
jgi:hypothetical protein